MVDRVLHSDVSLTANTTTNTIFQTHNTLTFTPSVNSSNIAIFYSCLMKNSGITRRSIVSLTHTSNSDFQLNTTALESKDSSDIIWVGGMAILENVANGSATSVSLRYRNETSGDNMTIKDARITALELVSTDVFDEYYPVHTVNRNGGSGYTSYVNQVSIAPGATGNYAVIASATTVDASASTTTGEATRIFTGDDTAENPYGFMGNMRNKQANDSDNYWMVMNHQNTSNTFSIRYNGEWSTTIKVSYQYILLLDLDAWNSTSIKHTEGVGSTVSTSAVDGISSTFTLTGNAGESLILASWQSQMAGITASSLANFQINGVNAFTTDNLQYEAPIGEGTGNFDAGSAWCNGFAGVMNLAQGSNTLRIRYWSENGSTTYIQSRNITALSNSKVLEFNIHKGGSFKKTITFNQNVSGVWKSHDSVYQKISGVWEQSDEVGDGIQGSYIDAINSNYQDTWPTSPSPSPPPSTCFVAGSLISMADGSFKPIEQVQIGDMVAGRWGANKVLGYDRPLLGNRPMWNINDEVLNTSDHLTWTRNGWAVIIKDTYISNDYRQNLFVIMDHETGEGEMMTYVGVNPDNVGEFKIGDWLAYKNNTFKEVKVLEPISLPPETQLYALVTDGDHTIHVNGYVFSGWANDEDYDYQTKIEKN